MSLTTVEIQSLDLDHEFDLDAEIGDLTQSAAAPAITSKFVCTPGCTSPGTGSFCSYCCC